MTAEPRILFCNCAYAQVVPNEVKQQVLKSLCESGQPFEAVADLCELSARKDSSLERLASNDNLQVIACYPRAVKWLFKAVKADLKENAVVHNMRTETAEAICQKISQEPAPA